MAFREQTNGEGVGVGLEDRLATAAGHERMGSVSNYAVVIHEEPTGGYWAEVPALPGCYTQAETVDELLANIREAIGAVLDVMAEDGLTPESNIQILDVAV
jgi:predicted RNase H-like HicB family nuclease